MSPLGKDWSGSRVAPKPKEVLGPRLRVREAGSKWSENSTLMPPFFRLRLGLSRTALGALDGYLVGSREVLHCRELLGELSRANLRSDFYGISLGTLGW